LLRRALHAADRDPERPAWRACGPAGIRCASGGFRCMSNYLTKST